MLGANELPLRQVFGLCPKRLYGALVSPARRPVPVRRKISRLTQYFRNRRKSDDFRRFCHFLREYGVGQNVGQTLTHTVTHKPK